VGWRSMPGKKHKGKKLSKAKQHKKAEAKKIRIAKKLERALRRKEDRLKANEAYNSWGGGILNSTVRSCDEYLAKLHEGDWPSNKDELVETHHDRLLNISKEIDRKMEHAIEQLARRKHIDVSEVVIGAVAVKPIEDPRVPRKDLVRWYSIAKKNALLVDQFHLHASKRSEHPYKVGKSLHDDSRPVRTEPEQHWLTLQDKANKGIHLRGKARQPTTVKVEEATDVEQEPRVEPKRTTPGGHLVTPPAEGRMINPRGGLSRRTQYPTFNLI